MILYTTCCNVGYQHHPHSGRFDPLDHRNQAVRCRCGRPLVAVEMSTDPVEPGAMDGVGLADATRDTRNAAVDMPGNGLPLADARRMVYGKVVHTADRLA